MESERCIVNKSIAVVLRVSRWFGIAPLRFVKLRNSFRISASRGYALLGQIIFGLFILHNICCNIYIQLANKNKQIARVRSMMSLCYLSLQLLMLAITWGFISITGIKRMHHIFNYMNVLQKLNENLGGVDIKMKHLIPLMCSFLFVILFAGAFQICYLVNAITLDFYGSVILLDIISNYVQYITIAMIEMQIIFVTYNVYATLHKLNQSLKSFNKKKKITRLIDTSVNAFHDPNLTKRMRDVYMSITELVREINKNEGILLFLILVYNILDLIDWIYITMTEISVTEGSTSGSRLSVNFILSLIWCIHATARLIILIEPFHWVYQEDTRHRVSHILLDWGQRKLTPEFDDFIEQVINNVPAFSVLEMCDLSRSLVFSILGFISSIMLLIKQFNLKDTLQ